MKYLVLFGVLGVVWWMWRKHNAEAPKPTSSSSGPAPAKKLVTCASCGVLLPENESVQDGGRIYCCEAHRKQAQAEAK